jgi:hypothetical protein
VVVVLTTTVLASACANSQDGAVSSVTRDFYEALAVGDVDAACTLLAPTTRLELERSSGGSCTESLPGEVPAAGDPTDIAVFGTVARVRLAGDTAFLARFQGGWAVLAAGCSPQEDAPYLCMLAGG